jgi:hypothetical protein
MWPVVAGLARRVRSRCGQGREKLTAPARGQVRVPHRHDDGRVPEPFLNLAERRSSHDKIARERMPEVVPPEKTKPGLTARSDESPVEVPQGQGRAVGL